MAHQFAELEPQQIRYLNGSIEVVERALIRFQLSRLPFNAEHVRLGLRAAVLDVMDNDPNARPGLGWSAWLEGLAMNFRGVVVV